MGNKYIHYCWFGNNPLPKLAKKCIKSWKKFLPDYEIICWNEDNFDVNETPFSKKAYEEGKWAFVSDVARVKALNEMGGIYLDTDMMINGPVSDDILNNEFFAGWESESFVAVGVLGAKNPGHPVISSLYEFYKENELNTADLFAHSIPRLLTRILIKDYGMTKYHSENQYLDHGIAIYSREYFYPIS